MPTSIVTLRTQHSLVTIAALWLLAGQPFGRAACVQPPAGLVNWWTADGQVYDQVGTLDGTLYNGTTFTSGEVRQALSFDGVRNCVTNVSPGLTNVISSYTVEFWAWPTASRATTVEGAGGITGNSGQRYAVFPSYGGEGNVGSGVSVGTNGVSVFEHGYAYLPSLLVYDVPISSWTHIAVVYQTNQPTLYLNGMQVRTGLTSSRNSYPSTWLGEWGSQSLNYGFYAGLLDEISIYNRPLSGAEIFSIYNAGSAGKCIPPPTPPTIVSQPTNQSVFVGGTASFGVAVAGTRPFAYQWSLAGTNLLGTTNSSLILTNVQLAGAGAYSVEITNLGGAVMSSNANLTVNLAPPCAPAPSGLISWWRGESNAWDQVSGNNGMFQNGPQYSAGEVGAAFYFDGNGDNVKISASPSLNVGAGSGMTIEAWINPADLQAGRPIFEWVLPNTYGVHFWINAAGPGSLYADLFDTSGASHIIQSATAVLSSNIFQHVALTYDKTSGVAQLFVNGSLVQSNSIGVFTLRTISDAYIGYRPVTTPYGPASFVGAIDELSLYSRALGAAEIQSLYGSGPSGKCAVAIPPFISSQPTNQAVTLYTTANITASAGGTPPLGFQWSLNGGAIPGATTNPLIITNFQSSQAGVYSLFVTNAFGSTTSSNAILTFKYPPVPIFVAGTNVLGGTVLTIPVMAGANGNENALGLSLNFDPTKLGYVGAAVANSSLGGVLLANTSQLNNGRLGLSLALPPYSTLPQGTQQVIRVSFSTTALTFPALTTLSFGDLPTPRQVWDARLNSLSANYSSAQITITPVPVPAPPFEGDTFPRPNGDNVVTLSDWLQVGRYVARLDYPTNATEFQRADCAPRSTSGDGAISIADWVQVGRYAAGLDGLASIGGPTAEIPWLGAGTSTNRVLTAGSALFSPGQPFAINLNLAAQGNENALGFSLSFNPLTATFVSAAPGADASGASFLINANQASLGRLGFALALGPGNSFKAGPRQVATLSFLAAASVAGSFTPSFADQPVLRDMSDTLATSLPAGYAGGTNLQSVLPLLRIEQSGTNVILDWPLWATNYLLQQSVALPFLSGGWSNVPYTLIVTNGAANAILPVDMPMAGFRLFPP